MTPAELKGAARALSPSAFGAAADVLKVSTARIRAVDAVESNGRGFHPETGRPVILFEPHVFSRRTTGRFDASHGEISYPKWGARPYPASQAQRYAQLETAMRLDEDAALKAASWGRFQIMGYNHRPAGGAAGEDPGVFPTVQHFVRAMTESEDQQLLAFARFVRANAAMHAALSRGDWAGFARLYNGPGFAQHGYDQKLKAAYARFSGAVQA